MVRVALLTVIALGGFAVLLFAASNGQRPSGVALASEVAEAPCSSASNATSRVDPSDAVLGPLVLLGARDTVGRRREAFDGNGYKMSATLPRGQAVTLAVPRAAQSRVRLVFTLSSQERVAEMGIEGGEAAVRFSCTVSGRTKRVGWPGGLVVDRPRCVTLVLKRSGEPPLRRRVPIGRAC